MGIYVMGIYLISQDVNNGYDTYDSAVVIANNESEAKMMYPSGRKWDGTDPKYSAWCSVEQVKCKYIGSSGEGESGVICASFNAG